MLKLFLLIVAMISVSILLDAQCIAGSCDNGKGTYLFSDGSQYSGEFHKGLPDGEGEWIYPKGEKIKGFFKKGLPVGEETFLRNNPTVKTGCISGNCRNGIGVRLNEAGQKYVGYFRRGQPSGKGVCYYPNGQRYDGQWKNGLRHGNGTLFKGDVKQKGVWKDGVFDHLERSGVETIGKTKGSRFAVVIGIADYQTMELLDYSDDDAYSFYQYLENGEHEKIPADNIRFLIDQNATAKTIKEALADVAKKATANDEIIIYYSGHGIAKAIIPYESDGKTGLVTHQEISNILKQSKATSKTLFIDACNKLETEASVDQSEGLGEDMTVFYSSSIGQNSLESNELKQGVFSYFLVQGLNGAADTNVDGRITNSELFDYIFENVQSYTEKRQFPTFAAKSFDPFGK